MFADAGSVTEGSTLDTDVCIVGAGPAGITLATQLEDTGVRTLVLEGGGLDRERAAEEPLRGERAGYPYPPLHRARVRAFGGTSRHWPPQTAMLTRPLDPIDFEARAAVPHSGWPFDHRHLRPFYERAHELCRLPRPDYDVERWTEEGEAPRLPLPEALIDTAIMRMAPPDAFTQQQARLRRSRDVTVLLHATVVEICTGPTADRVDRLRVAREPGRTFGVTARCYVLASGGLDTPRLLLHSRERWRDGLGNAHGLVGRFFMEHLGARAGVLHPSDPDLLARAGLYRRHHGPLRWQGMLTPAGAVLRDEGLGNAAFFLEPVDRAFASPAVDALATLARVADHRPVPPHLTAHARTALRHAGDLGVVARRRARRGPRPPAEVLLIRSMTEQLPNPASRVTLASRRDRFGMPQVRSTGGSPPWTRARRHGGWRSSPPRSTTRGSAPCAARWAGRRCSTGSGTTWAPRGCTPTRDAASSTPTGGCTASTTCS